MSCSVKLFMHSWLSLMQMSLIVSAMPKISRHFSNRWVLKWPIQQYQSTQIHPSVTKTKYQNNWKQHVCMFSQGLICCEVKSVQILRIRELLQNNQLRGSLYSCDAMKTEIEVKSYNSRMFCSHSNIRAFTKCLDQCIRLWKIMRISLLV